MHNTISTMAAGVVASFSLQGIPGATQRQQMLAMAIIGFALVLSFATASILHPYPLGVSLLLITVSFLCFYLRRFGAIFNIFAVSVWATCFIGTIMPSASLLEAAQHTVAAFIGFIIAFILNFTLFPENRLLSYFVNLRTYLSNSATQLLWLAVHVTKPTAAPLFQQQMLRYLEDRRQLILINQTILESFINSQKLLLKKLNKYYIAMHAIGKALSILNESCYQIAVLDDKPAPEVQQQLAMTFSYFAKFLQNIQVDETRQILRLEQKPEDCYRYVQNFKDILLTYELDDKTTSLLTIHLGFQQLWHSLRKL